ncbi:Ig-like domain-containing protein [Streptomyces sp. NPDC059009]|uniref:L,D-transpeptidase n=1 Tax=Streptomyces sp. NPDC059009 TaxID=3346694 RepID=UPI0036AA641B
MEKRVTAQYSSRRNLLTSSALIGAGLVLSACGVAKKDEEGKGADAAAGKQRSQARIAVLPKDGATRASINKDAKVTVREGTLTRVSMTGPKGTPVKGTMAADRRSWRPDGRLERGTVYKISATAKDSNGLETRTTSSFTTVSEANSFIGTFTPDDGATVGVGMPVSINFDKAITDRKAVQSRITVTSSTGQEVVGHWFGDRRLDFRPEKYWTAGSTVTLKLRLDGVEGSRGVFGIQDRTITFKVGRSQVSTVDVATKSMTVTRDGNTIKTIPISAGSAKNPTYNGEMVISEMFKETRMDGSTVGFGGEYDIPDVPHAMRLSTSGTFIHGNYWGADSIFGNSNTSHGCVGLNDVKGGNDPGQPGSWYYSNSMIGDLVIVKNSPDTTIKPDNGLNGWNMSWAEWKAGSAI